MKRIYFIMYWSTYDYEWKIFEHETNLRTLKRRLNDLILGREHVDGDPEQFDAHIATRLVERR